MTRLEENTPSGVQEGKSSWSCFACGAKRGWGESEGCCGLRKFEDLYILDGVLVGCKDENAVLARLCGIEYIFRTHIAY